MNDYRLFSDTVIRCASDLQVGKSLKTQKICQFNLLVTLMVVALMLCQPVMGAENAATKLAAADQIVRRAQGLETLSLLAGWTSEKANKWAATTEGENGPLGSFTVDFVLGEVWSREQLSRRDRSLVVLAMLAAQNLTNQLNDYVPWGVHTGLTADEIREVFLQVAGYGGFPRALDAMAVANPLLADMGLVPANAQPAISLTGAERRERSIEVLTLLSGKNPSDPGEIVAGLAGNMGAIVDAGIDFVFGEIWARPQLSRRDRSLVVVSILTALGRGDELNIHVPVALRHGVTRIELEELMVTAFVYAGAPSAVEGMVKVMKYAPPQLK